MFGKSRFDQLVEDLIKVPLKEEDAQSLLNQVDALSEKEIKDGLNKSNIKKLFEALSTVQYPLRSRITNSTFLQLLKRSNSFGINLLAYYQTQSDQRILDLFILYASPVILNYIALNSSVFDISEALLNFVPGQTSKNIQSLLGNNCPIFPEGTVLKVFDFASAGFSLDHKPILEEIVKRSAFIYQFIASKKNKINIAKNQEAFIKFVETELKSLVDRLEKEEKGQNWKSYKKECDQWLSFLDDINKLFFIDTPVYNQLLGFRLQLNCSMHYFLPDDKKNESDKNQYRDNIIHMTTPSQYKIVPNKHPYLLITAEALYVNPTLFKITDSEGKLKATELAYAGACDGNLDSQNMLCRLSVFNSENNISLEDNPLKTQKEIDQAYVQALLYFLNILFDDLKNELNKNQNSQKLVAELITVWDQKESVNNLLPVVRWIDNIPSHLKKNDVSRLLSCAKHFILSVILTQKLLSAPDNKISKEKKNNPSHLLPQSLIDEVINGETKESSSSNKSHSDDQKNEKPQDAKSSINLNNSLTLP